MELGFKNKNMKIGIIGIGIVGGAVKYGMEALGHKVKYHDIKYNTKLEDVLDTEICYICVPTPKNSNSNSCNVTIVEDVIQHLNNASYKGIIAIKSTVEPGTTENLQKLYPNLKICFVPEFLRERCAIADFVENHDLLIIGTKDSKIYKLIKKSHGKYPKITKMITETEAELCKYFNNVYNATLITLANSFYEVCKSMDVDYTNMKEAISCRKNISNVYLDCNENFRGFGGMCLPKDTAAMDYITKKYNLNIDFFKVILSENEKYKTTVYKGMRK